jgi:hypothetical protein
MANDDSLFLVLFTHKLRADWGVCVLAGEADGKRRYLFEDGEERRLVGEFDQMMDKVDSPDANQQAVYLRLKAQLATRGCDAAQPARCEAGFLEQLARLRLTYPAGFQDPKWISETRGDGAELRVPRHRQAMIQDAQARLARDTVASLAKHQHFGELWAEVVAVLRETDLVPAAHLTSTQSADAQRTLALALCELLHGKRVFGTRFDKYVFALRTAFGQAPSWELSTAVCSLVHPTEHVCVEPMLFGRQLKVTPSRRSIPSLPNGAGYANCLSIARQVAKRLTEQGEVPRDLLEVRDFMAFTLPRSPNRRRAA